jgi:hypothetical protein
MWFIHVLHLVHPTLQALYKFCLKLKTKEKNSSHTKERNKSKKTTVPVVEGCEDQTCTDLGVEDDHYSGIRSIIFECQVKLDIDNFHTFLDLAEGRRN